MVTSKKLPSRNIPLCGTCGKGISAQFLQSNSAYKTNCHICGSECFNHVKCATKFVSNYDPKNRDQPPVTPDIVTKCQHDFYCHKCQQKECFHCNSKHERGE